MAISTQSGARAGSLTRWPRTTPLRRAFLRWRGRAHRLRPVALVATGGAALFFALAILAGGSWLFGGRRGFFGADISCAENQFSCGALLELVTTLLAGAIAYVSFQYWRAYRVVSTHLKEGRDEPWKLVPTATEMRNVVGRDDICDIIEDHLCQSDRRPQILVAGVGEGKTAVLVQLTTILAERGAVPVPVRLRDADGSLDFVELAKKRFQECVDPQIMSDDEGDKVWRKFFSDGRIVVLADGLDEVMPKSDAREQVIRAGVERAAAEHLPLVIASRPDEALENLDAALIHLEPLSSAAAVRCIRRAKPKSTMKVREFVENAGIAEAPLFLHLARELHTEQGLDTWNLGTERLEIRIQLLKHWCEWLLQGRAVAQIPADRRDALDALGGMACHGLATHSFEVNLEEAEKSPYLWGGGRPKTPLARVARVGQDMELVDRVDKGIRFRHSLMQAYLGAQALPKVLDHDGDGYLDIALADPGRELLIALAIHCKSSKDDDRREGVCARLEQAARSHRVPVSLDLLAAAYQIDAMIEGKVSRSLAATAKDVWSRAAAPRPLSDVKADEAKLRAILRMGQAGGVATYEVLWRVCLNQDIYGIRLAAAQALAGGGMPAQRAIEAYIDDGPRLRQELRSDGAGVRARRDTVRRGSLLGWILPTLLDTSSPPEKKVDQAPLRKELDAWITRAEQGLHLGVESCFAQGFKHAANRLPHRTDREVRTYLIGLALRLLGSSNWWYTRLCLVHALTLWAVGLDHAERLGIADDRDDDQRRADAKLRDQLIDIVQTAAGSEPHPFVRDAAALCREAFEAPEPDDDELRSGPSPYVWIDETGVVTRIGSRDAVPDPFTRAGLWIPPAVGWHTLVWPARRLAAEVLLCLNLIEGGEEPSGSSLNRRQVAQKRERRRQEVALRGSQLPACIVGARDREEWLMRKRDKLADGSPEPCPKSCRFELCPYPARSERPFRGEMSETFCREQKRILRTRLQRVTRNQYVSLLPLPTGITAAGKLQKFWTEMEKRVARIGV